MTALTQDILKELLQYDPSTGDFVWRKDHGVNAKAGALAGVISPVGYRQIGIGSKTYLGHRLAFLYMTGAFPPETVDHANGVRSDNRFENLRAATQSENIANRGPNRNNKVGLKGVSRFGNRYRAQITANRKHMYLGLFDTAEEAHEAYCAASAKHFGGFARSSWGTTDGASPFTSSDTVGRR